LVLVLVKLFRTFMHVLNVEFIIQINYFANNSFKNEGLSLC